MLFSTLWLYFAQVSCFGVVVVPVVTCDQAPDICDINAQCVWSTDTDRYECRCIDTAAVVSSSGDGDDVSSTPSCDSPVDGR